MEKKPTKAEMEQWFRGEYETANQALFHDNQEGGYQYPPGEGPVDVSNSLQEKFPNADPKDVEQLSEKLDDEGPWVDMRSIDEDNAARS